MGKRNKFEVDSHEFDEIFPDPNEAEQAKLAEIKHEALEKMGFTRASQHIEAFKNRRCYFMEPLSLALAIGRIDPITSLPGMPMGTIAELAGGNGTGKTLTFEHFAKHVLADDPTNKVACLFFEEPNLIRMDGLQDQGLDMSRIYRLDYSNPEKDKELESAEEGLNTLLAAAVEFKDIKMCVIDSLGAMAMKKEVVDKEGNFLSVDKTPQAAIRATIFTRFTNQWLTINPNERPILFLINHMKDQLKSDGGFGYDPMQVTRIGENLNYTTPCGVGFKYACDLRIKINAKRIDIDSGKTKHKLFNSSVQEGIEIQYDVYKNKFCADQGSRRAQGNFYFGERKFDLEEEILSYAEYLRLDDISKTGNGRYTVPKISDKSYFTGEACAKLAANPEYKQELIKKIALRHNDLFSIPGKQKRKDADQIL